MSILILLIYFDSLTVGQVNWACGYTNLFELTVLSESSRLEPKYLSSCKGSLGWIWINKESSFSRVSPVFVFSSTSSLPKFSPIMPYFIVFLLILCSVGSCLLKNYIKQKLGFDLINLGRIELEKDAFDLPLSLGA